MVVLTMVALLVSGVVFYVRCYSGMGMVDHEEGMETVAVVNAKTDEVIREEGNASQPGKWRREIWMLQSHHDKWAVGYI